MNACFHISFLALRAAALLSVTAQVAETLLGPLSPFIVIG
jgi:hypothetical protein